MVTKNMKIEQKIAKKYGIKLHFVKRGDKFCKANGEDAYINRSCCAGGIKRHKNHKPANPEIWIGIYTDNELKLASFFHEVGHIIDPIENVDVRFMPKYKVELWAWQIGFKLAESYGISFSPKTKRWANSQVKSYKNEY